MPIHFRWYCGMDVLYFHNASIMDVLEEEMATLTIKNLPDNVYRALTRLARQHRRSINSEAIVRLEESVKARSLDVEATIERLRTVRNSTSEVWATEDWINGAKNEGRP